MTATTHGYTRQDLFNLPPVLDLGTAARILGISRYKAYELVRCGDWPTRVLRLGRSVRVPTAELLALIGLSGPTQPRRLRVVGGARRP